MKALYCLILSMIGLFVFCQTAVRDVYDFPLKQGSKEWTQIESVEKRIAALQLPEAVLKKISTEGLLETCLNYPYLIDFLHVSGDARVNPTVKRVIIKH
jgi:hypothetical protein